MKPLFSNPVAREFDASMPIRLIEFLDIVIPNRIFAWELSTKQDDSAEIQKIREQVNEYNQYVTHLITKNGFLESFNKHGRFLSQQDVSQQWGDNFVDFVFGLKKYPFYTSLIIGNDVIFDPCIEPVQTLKIFNRQLEFSISETDAGYPHGMTDASEGEERNYRILWNWYTGDLRDFTYYLWGIFDEQSLLPQIDYDSEEEPEKDYSGYECYEQHRYDMDYPDLNLMRCLEILQECNYLSVFNIKSSERNPWIYYDNIAENRIATVVKVIHRCNNISTMATAFSRKKMAAYIEETETFVMLLLQVMKDRYPEYYNAAFLLKYQMRSILESLKRTV